MKFSSCASVAILLVCLAKTLFGGPLNVVGTLSTFADLAQTIGGDRVSVIYIAPPTFDPHHITPKPGDVLKLKKADLLLHSGVELEAWLEPLLDVVGKSSIRHGGGRNLDLSHGVQMLEIPQTLSRSEGDIHGFGNPHFWLSPANGLIMAGTIANKLEEVDPAGREIYRKNLQVFTGELQQRISDWKVKLQGCRNMELMAYHNQWVYFANFFGLKIEKFIEPKPGIPPSARHLAELIEYANKGSVTAIIDATFMPKSSMEGMGRKCRLPVCYLCQNVHEIKEVKNYISMLDYNVMQLAGVACHKK